MRNITILGTVIAIIGGALQSLTYAQSSLPATTNPCEIKISTDKSSYERGAAVFLKVTVKNNPPHVTVLSYPETAPLCCVTYDGRAVSPTRRGKSAAQAMQVLEGSNEGKVLKDDASSCENILLSEIVDLTIPGKYEVVVKCVVFDFSGKNAQQRFQVESNTLQFEINNDVKR